MLFLGGNWLVRMKQPKCLWHMLSDPEEITTTAFTVIFFVLQTFHNPIYASHLDLILNLIRTGFLESQRYILQQRSGD